MIIRLLPLFYLVGHIYALQCLYYRVRADEPLSEDNMMVRNCSGAATACVKIISRNTLSGNDDTEIISSIEGRCAFSTHECVNRMNECSAEPAVQRYEVTIYEHKCCSNESLSNQVKTISGLGAITNLCLMTIITYFI